MWCHMKHFVVENPGCSLTRLGVLSHFMVSRAAHVVLRSSDASSQEVPQVTKTILMAAISFRPPPPSSHFSGIGSGPYPLPWMPHATDLAQMPHFFCFTSLPDRPCVHVFRSFYAFLGVGGALGAQKNGKKQKCWIFHTNTHASGTRMSA